MAPREAVVDDDERVSGRMHNDVASEAVLDKGYHGRETLLDLEELGVRSYARRHEAHGRYFANGSSSDLEPQEIYHLYRHHCGTRHCSPRIRSS